MFLVLFHDHSSAVRWRDAMTLVPAETRAWASSLPRPREDVRRSRRIRVPFQQRQKEIGQDPSRKYEYFVVKSRRQISLGAAGTRLVWKRILARVTLSVVQDLCWSSLENLFYPYRQTLHFWYSWSSKRKCRSNYSTKGKINQAYTFLTNVCQVSTLIKFVKIIKHILLEIVLFIIADEPYTVLING